MSAPAFVIGDSDRPYTRIRLLPHPGPVSGVTTLIVGTTPSDAPLGQENHLVWRGNLVGRDAADEFRVSLLGSDERIVWVRQATRFGLPIVVARAGTQFARETIRTQHDKDAGRPVQGKL